MKALILLLLVAATAQADTYWIRDGDTLKPFNLESMAVGEFVSIVRIRDDGTTPIPDPDPPIPTGLRQLIGTAAKNANDPANTTELLNMYTTVTALIDAKVFTPASAAAFLIRGELLILDTPAEQQSWTDFRVITARELGTNPINRAKIDAIHSGLKDVAPSAKAPPAWIRPLGWIGTPSYRAVKRQQYASMP